MNDKHTDIFDAQGTPFDWQQIYRRLEAVRTAVEQNAYSTPQQKQTILKARAKALAHAPKSETVDTSYLEVVAFQLEQEQYALETTYIREVYQLKELTPVPCTPRFVLGIINVRGQILSVLDLKVFFNLPAKGITDLNKVIILHSKDMEFGILADAILGVRSLPLSALHPSLPTLSETLTAYLKGVTAERLIILDAAKILADKKIIVHEEVG